MVTSAKRWAGSGGHAEGSGLFCGVTLDEDSWNIEWGLEGCILAVTLVGVCLGSGPENNYNYVRLQFLMAVTMKITVFKDIQLLSLVYTYQHFKSNLVPTFFKTHSST